MKDESMRTMWKTFRRQLAVLAIIELVYFLLLRVAHLGSVPHLPAI